MVSKEKIIEAFRRNGFRATLQRTAIAQIVLNRKDHPTAEQVFNIVRRGYPLISLSTVYNTLNTLRNVNMVRELAFNDDATRFDPNMQVHFNLVCDRCGSISDFEDRNIKEFIDKAGQKARFHVTGMRFDLYGICDKCMDDLKDKQ